MTSTSSHAHKMAQQVLLQNFKFLSILQCCKVFIHISSYPVASEDYQAVNIANEPFRGRPFSTNKRRECFNVLIVNDNFPENAESFVVTIRHSVPSPLVIVEPDEVMITILDRDSEWAFKLQNR